ncbi:MAG TPA: MMPL family transporter [Spirochaetota bacterium]|nr:MMPL family transporter [Spirochaetota bacterium]
MTIDNQSWRRYIFQQVARFSAENPVKILAATVIVTLLAVVIASGLKVQMTWLDMVPQDNPAVAEFERISRNFGSATDIILTIENESKSKMKKIAREVAAELRRLQSPGLAELNGKGEGYLFKDVDCRLDQDFILEHGLMLQKTADLKESKDIFRNLDLVPFMQAVNDNFEKTYIGGKREIRGNQHSVIQGINSYMDVLRELHQLTGKEAAAARGRICAGNYFDDMLYSFSIDKKMLMLMLQPACSVDDIKKIGIIVPLLRQKLQKYKKKYPDTVFRHTGFHVIMQDEMEAATQDSMVLTNIAFFIILIAFVILFRMWGSPLIAMLVLLVGIAWDMALAEIFIGRLNIMTAMTAVMLIGLGVDFFAHFLTAYNEGRDKGMISTRASVYAAGKAGEGIFTGALTTAAVMFCLMLADMKALQELGLVIGCGILTTMLASFIIMPAVLSLMQPREKYHIPVWVKFLSWLLAVVTILPLVLMLINYLNKKFFSYQTCAGQNIFRRAGSFITQKPRRVFLTGIAVIAGLSWFIQYNWFDQNIMNIEMKGLESVELQREIVRRYGLSDTPVMYATTNLEQTQKLHHRIDKHNAVGMVNSIASFIPLFAKQQKRLPYLKQIQQQVGAYTPGQEIDRRHFIREVNRFKTNLLELRQLAAISDQELVEKRLDTVLVSNKGFFTTLEQKLKQVSGSRLSAFQKAFGSTLKTVLFKMSGPQLINYADVPPALKADYVNTDQTEFLTTAFSKKDIWNAPTESRFIKFMRQTVKNVTGTPVFMVDLINIVAREGKTAMYISLLVIFLLVLLDFKQFRPALISLLPLALAMLTMFAVTGLLQYPFNVVSVMVLPLIIGIGIDDGVHILHRYRIEKKHIPTVLQTTGKALFFTSFTTMVGFGSLMFAKYQGFVGMGLVLFIGIGACFLITIIIVPALLKLLDSKKR